MAQPVVGRSPGLRRRAFETARPDAWWVPQLVTFLVFSGFVVYSTWAAFQGDHYRSGPYLSPMYSPEVFGDAEHSWFGGKPDWWPGWIPWSAAFFILWAPGGFRLTCYYYRGAYYKAFWADPPSCTVGEPRHRYRGEQSFPLILQNVHRYFLYLALLFLPILAWDVWKALWFEDPATGAVSFGVGVGTLVLALNLVLLSGYTFGCHTLRHLAGGGLDRLAASRGRYSAYRCAGCFNRRHMLWAWSSLVVVGFSDLYVRLCSMGIWSDVRLF